MTSTNSAQIVLTVLRCSACNQTHSVLAGARKSKCPSCGEAYYRLRGSWRNEKLRDLYTRKKKK